jgi:hypothetical protein
MEGLNSETATIIGSIIQAVATICTGICAGIIGIGAVVVTIFQIRKSEKEIIRNNYGWLMDEHRAIMFTALDDENALQSIMSRFCLTKTAQGKERLFLLAMLQVDHYEHVYLRHKQHLFPDELWPNWEGSMMASKKNFPFEEIYASEFSKTLSEDFREYMKI